MRRVLARGVCFGAGLVAALGAKAQPALPPPSEALPAVEVAPVGAQTGVRRGGLTIEPSVSFTETLTDNSRPGGGGGNGRADLISQVTPSVRITSQGGRVRGYVDYSLSAIGYLRSASSNELQNRLAANVVVEAVENWAYLDASANVSQQSISAFGTRTADSSLANGNRTETRSFSLSPYVRGRLFGAADYEARYTQTWNRNGSTDLGDSTSSQTFLRLSGDRGSQLLSWSVDASLQTYDFDAGRRTDDDRVRGILFVVPDPQLRISLIEGIERNNIASLEKENHSTPGLGVDWQPSERTRLSAEYEKRFFGNSHSYSFDYRTPRTAWRISDTQDITTGFAQPTLTSLGTIYDLFFQQFASLQPDPALRAVLVDAFLRANGISPTAQLFAGSLASTVTRQRRQQLSFAFLGLRDTLTLAASRTKGGQLGPATLLVGDFANNNQIDQRGVSVSLAHRLTPSAALDVVASIDRVSGSVRGDTTILRSLSAIWNLQVSRRGSLAVAARHSSFSSQTDPYTENAVSATLGLRF